MIAYNSNKLVNLQPSLTSKQVLYAHITWWVIALVLALIAVKGLNPARLMPSGTYCMVSLIGNKSALGSGLIFYITCELILGTFIVHRYISIYINLKKMQSLYLNKYSEKLGEKDMNSTIINVNSTIINVQTKIKSKSFVEPYENEQKIEQNGTNIDNKLFVDNKIRQFRAMQRMIILVFAFFVSIIPLFVVSLFELISGQDASPIFHIVAGIFAHLNSLIDPILYAYLNPSMRKEILNLFKEDDDLPKVANKFNLSKVIPKGNLPSTNIKSLTTY